MLNGVGPTEQGLTSSGRPPESSAADVFGEVARALQAEPNLNETLQAIVMAAVANIDGADVAGITLVSGGGKISTPAATDDLVCRIDQLQYETGEGPCLSSARDRITVRAGDLRTERRWPRFAARAADLGVLSVLAFQLYVEERDLGALNLYSRAEDAFGPADEQTGLLFATHAAIALVGAQHEHTLHQAMINSDIIGQAKGVLMERHKITAEAAFLMMARVSQQTNQRLHVVARMVASTGLDPRAATESAPLS